MSAQMNMAKVALLRAFTYRYPLICFHLNRLKAAGAYRGSRLLATVANHWSAQLLFTAQLVSVRHLQDNAQAQLGEDQGEAK